MYANTDLFIDGAWAPAASGHTIPVLNPATNEEIGRLAHAGVADLDRALAAAQAGFKLWRKVSAFERSKIIRRAAETLREQRRIGRVPAALAGRTVALLFEKPSLRTRVTFDVGLKLLGGHPVYLSPEEVGIGHRETATDVGRNLSRWVDGIVFRTFGHDTLVELASVA